MYKSCNINIYKILIFFLKNIMYIINEKLNLTKYKLKTKN